MNIHIISDYEIDLKSPFTGKKWLLDEKNIKKSSLEELYKWRRNRTYMCLDVETRATVDVRELDSLTLLQVGDRFDIFLIHPDLFPDKEFFEDIKIVGFNISFDYNIIKQKNILLDNVVDVYLAVLILNTGNIKNDDSDGYIQESYDFATIVQLHTSVFLDKSSYNAFVSDSLNKNQIQYAVFDVYYLDILYEVFYSKLKEQDLLQTWHLENEYCLVKADMIYNGCYLDFVQWMQNVEKNKITVVELERQMDSILKKEFIEIHRKFISPKYLQYNLFSTVEREITLNYSSPAQIKKVLKQMECLPKDKYGKETTSIVYLEEMENKNNFVKTFIEGKQIQKKISSFGENWKKYINPNTGRIHCSFLQIINTGRVASYSPNLYQMPRETMYRSCIKAEGEDYFIIGADYSSQEGRIMAEMANDVDYIEFFNSGKADAHSFVASKMLSASFKREIELSKKSMEIDISDGYNKDILIATLIGIRPINVKSEVVNNKLVLIFDEDDNFWRQNGKILNFFLSFGGSAHTLSQKLKISKQEAEVLIREFFTVFKGLKVFFTEQSKFAWKNGYSVNNSITKRKRWFPDWEEAITLKNSIDSFKEEWGEDVFFSTLKNKDSNLSKSNRRYFVLKGEIEREGQNNPIQSTAADMTKTAGIILRRKLIDLNILPFSDAKIKILLMPHDEIQLESHKTRVRISQKLLEDSMEEAGRVFVKKINMRPKSTVSKYWKK